MADQPKISQVQQITSEWEKFVGGQMANLESALGELGKLESKGVAQMVGGFEEAGRFAKDYLGVAERVHGEWRKLAVETARRTATLLTPKQ
jgi:hypothetical protein